MPIPFDNLSRAIQRAAKTARSQRAFEARLDEGRDEKKSPEKKKKKRRKTYQYAFAPLLYRGNLGTPKEGDISPYGQPPAPSTPPGGGGTSSGGGGGASPPSMGSSLAPPSRTRVLHEMKRSLGLLEFAGTGAGGIAWLGYAVPNPLSVSVRQGGPTIGGPGFANNSDGKPTGGVYDPAKSPGLGFRTEAAWRVWKAALDIISADKTLPSGAILQAAFQRAAVKMPQLDPAEVRLLEMGIQWYLSDPVPYAAKRDSGFGPSGGSTSSPNMISGGS